MGKRYVPTAILTADWHLRDTQPVCRTDDFWESQWIKIAYIAELQRVYNCPIIHAGDLFHTWRASPHLLSTAIEYFKGFSNVIYSPAFFTVYGNHDLPQHSMKLAYKSGVNTLAKAGAIAVLDKGHWGENEPEDISCQALQSRTFQDVAVWHKFTYTGKKPWPNCTDPTGEQLLKKYPDYKLILTGDNHTPFVVKYKDRLLVNPGSITRQTSDQIDHTPRVYLWYSETNTVEEVYLPIKQDVITREHIEVTEERNARMEAFVSRLKEDWNVTLSFEDNLRSFLSTNKLRKAVVGLIHQAMDPGDVK